MPLPSQIYPDINRTVQNSFANGYNLSSGVRKDREEKERQNALAQALPGAFRGDEGALNSLAQANPQLAAELFQHNQTRQDKQFTANQTRQDEQNETKKQEMSQAFIEAYVGVAGLPEEQRASGQMEAIGKLKQAYPGEFDQISEIYDPNKFKQLGYEIASKNSKLAELLTQVGILPQEGKQGGLDQKIAELKANGIDPNSPEGQKYLGMYVKPQTPQTVVSVNTGQKGFDNELKLRSDFRSEPVYKAFQEVQGAFSQIKAGLNAESPAGDMAAATKFMKILDPTSVVRESELAMAMAANGLLDRLYNYAQMKISGEKLTPTQREDFRNLTGQFYEEARKQFTAKQLEYRNMAEYYEMNQDHVAGDLVPTAVNNKERQNDGNNSDMDQFWNN